jgi:hypothetical protein
MALNDQLTNDAAAAWWQAELKIQLQRFRRDNNKDVLELEADE